MFKQRILPLLLLVLLAGVVNGPAAAETDSTYWVTNTNDSGPGSLRQAITDANNHPGPDDIAFNIPTNDPGCGSTCWIVPTSPLPALTDGGTILDGATQTVNQGDVNPYGPEVGISGFNLGSSASILYIRSNANQVWGMTLVYGAKAAISISSGASGNIIRDNFIGVAPPSTWPDPNRSGIVIFGGSKNNVIAHNVISGNDLDGVFIAGADTSHNKVRRNYIGLDATGTVAIPNGRHGVFISTGSSSTTVGGEDGYRNYIGGNEGHGVLISGSDFNNITHNYIGVNSAGDAALGNKLDGVRVADGSKSTVVNYNLISGNEAYGIFLEGAGTEYNYVQDNIIGADKEVTKLIPNHLHGVGVYSGADDNTIGDHLSQSLGNVIVGNGWSGVAIVNSSGNLVGYNAVGTDKNGTGVLGNRYHGIAIVNGSDNQVLHNAIAFNGTYAIRAGVIVDGASSSGNSIQRNSIHDNSGEGIQLKNGANSGVMKPEIYNVSCAGVEGRACPGCNVEIFSDIYEEGKTYEGQTTAHATLASFSWSGVVHGPYVTVTNTDGNGNTSEFSLPYLAILVCNLPPTADFTVIPTSGITITAFEFYASTSSDAEDPLSVLEVRWDWEDDGVYDTTWTTDKFASHQYPIPGTYTIRLQVRDSGGLTDTATRQVTVNPDNTPPTASFTVTPNQGNPNTAFYFDAAISSDADEPTKSISIRWDWEDDGVYDTLWTTDKTAIHHYSAPGTYTVRLEVRDGEGLTDSTSQKVIVGDYSIYLPMTTR